MNAPRVNPIASRRLVYAFLACVVAGCKSSGTDAPKCVVSAVTVSPPSATLVIGAYTTLQANVTQTGCTNLSVQWQSVNEAIATVSQSGLVTGVAAGGPIAVQALAGGQVGSSSITVTQAPVASVAISGGRSDMLAGTTMQLSATTTDDHGNVLAGRAVTWSTSNAAVASVSSQLGLVTGVSIGGPVTITATSEGKTATFLVNVNGRLAYAVVSTPSAATPTVDAGTTFSASGLPITIRKIATGQFEVTFAGMGRVNSTTQKETFIVNAKGVGNATCSAGGWGPVGTNDLFANLQCSSGGALTDVPFSILLLGDDAFGGRTAFTWADTPAAASPYGGPSTWTYNPAGAAAQITHQSTGMYQVVFTSDGRVSGSLPETFLVSAKSDALALCQVQNWTLSTATVVVKCTDGGGTVRDAQFTIAMIDRGRPGARAAYAWANCASASCTPNATYQYSSVSSTITVDHTSLGVYLVHFPGLARPTGATDAVFVSAYGAAGVVCKVVSWSNATGNTELTATVQCFSPGLSLADALFDILLVQ